MPPLCGDNVPVEILPAFKAVKLAPEPSKSNFFWFKLIKLVSICEFVKGPVARVAPVEPVNPIIRVVIAAGIYIPLFILRN